MRRKGHVYVKNSLHQTVYITLTHELYHINVFTIYTLTEKMLLRQNTWLLLNVRQLALPECSYVNLL